jgi:hypothetical protein
MRFTLFTSVILSYVSQTCLGHFPYPEVRSESEGVLIVPPPNLSNQTGLKQIPGEFTSYGTPSALLSTE